MMQRLVTDRLVVDDLLHGQVVIISARWILVLAGLLLAMWNPASLTELRIEIFVLLCLAVVNFYLHLHLIVQRHSEPFLMRVITLASMGALGTYYWRIQRRRREQGLAPATVERY